MADSTELTGRDADVVDRVLGHYPRTYAEDLDTGPLDQPAPLFQLLVMSLLMSARIRASVAFEATRALMNRNWTTARAIADATWEDRTRVLNRAGYARYDERTSTMLGQTSTLLLERYDGDLRRLRDEAGHDPGRERRLLEECKGMGDVGVDIFFREVQVSWDELYPFADRRAREAGSRLGLGEDITGLHQRMNRIDFVRLVNGLARVDVEDTYATVTGSSDDTNR